MPVGSLASGKCSHPAASGPQGLCPCFTRKAGVGARRGPPTGKARLKEKGEPTLQSFSREAGIQHFPSSRDRWRGEAREPIQVAPQGSQEETSVSTWETALPLCPCPPLSADQAPASSRILQWVHRGLLFRGSGLRPALPPLPRQPAPRVLGIQGSVLYPLLPSSSPSGPVGTWERHLLGRQPCAHPALTWATQGRGQTQHPFGLCPQFLAQLLIRWNGSFFLC